MPPPAHFTGLAAAVGSRFFTMDLAKTVAGEWLVVELGDAQVAALPEDADADTFFTNLRAVAGDGERCCLVWNCDTGEILSATAFGPHGDPQDDTRHFPTRGQHDCPVKTRFVPAAWVTREFLAAELAETPP